MNHSLNFVYGHSEINGNHFFHKSAIYDYVNNNSNFSKTFNYQISNSTKNLFLLECKESLVDFFKKDSTGRTILNTVPIEFIHSIQTGDVKILLTSVAEATKITKRLFRNIILELKRFGLNETHLIIIDSNQNIVDCDNNFKIFSNLHFLVKGSYVPNELNDLNYISEAPSETEVREMYVRQKHFICLNRISFKPHRYYLSLFFEKNNLYDKAFYSILTELRFNNFKKLNYLEYYKNTLSEKIPMELDTQNRTESLYSFNTTNTIYKPHYLNSYFNIVTETCFEHNQIFFTEKIVKPLLCLQPFIVVSSVGYLKKLKKLGFKTFDSIWDESYDDIIDNEDRLIKIFDLILEISNWSLNVCEKNYKKVLDICIYNRNHLYSFWDIDDFGNILNSIENEW